MSVRWTNGALRQLSAAHDWIEKENPTAAYEFLEAVTALVDLLGEYPGMGVQTRQPGVLMFPLVRYRYLIFYRVVRREGVRIIRIRHASRKRPS
jgi:plasmid stabilization system protein ParE